MSFLCTTRNKEVSYHQCMNECQYFFKSACIDKMNEAYNQALEDLKFNLEEEKKTYAYNGHSLDTDKWLDDYLESKLG